ncbi:MAG: c-type cytochrome [Planctomycetaceae bacterium]|nr:c-type cytochrome [Planctomycetaceae bacterium]
MAKQNTPNQFAKWLLGWLSIWFATAFAAPPCVAQGFSPSESLRQMQLADGFRVNIIAAEPLVRQPVAIEFDDRGRLWVIQYLQYPNPAGLKRIQVDRYSRTKYDRIPAPPPHGPRGADRISILEDTNRDGQMDSSKDFIGGLNLASGIAFGHGGVFVLNVPYLLFYPDRNRDDIPDSDPEVLLTGFGMEDAHSVANSLTWGPDGWLYGCQGSTVTARIRGIEFQQGVWRYHPVKKQFELFCEGGGNSWGLDFDAVGNLFYSTNYGGYVLLHGVQGGYFVKSFSKHGNLHNPHAYGYFNHAPHDNFYGGHVTVGGIVYQGNTFPASFRGKYVAADLLGHGVYWHEIQPHGSTVKTAHGGELLASDDRWFAPTDVTTGPDGSVYVSDWHDARTAHPDPDADWDRSNGRIIRISYATQASSVSIDPPAIDIAQLPTKKLLSLHQHKNQWWVRKARNELANRSTRAGHLGMDLSAIQKTLFHQVSTAQDQVTALESLWTLEVTGGLNEALASQLLQSQHPAVRLWVIQLLGNRATLSDAFAHRLNECAEQEPVVEVRRQLASTAKRLPARHAAPLIYANMIRDVDGNDPYLNLLWWWAVEHHSIRGREEILNRFVRPSNWESRLGREELLPRLIRRYAAEGGDDGLSAVVRLLASAPDNEAREPLWQAILAGWHEQHSDDHAVAIAQTHDFSRIVIQAWKQRPADLHLTELAVALRHRAAIDVTIRDAFDDSIDLSRRVGLLKILAKVQPQQIVEPALALVSSSNPEPIRQAALKVVSQLESQAVTNQLIRLLLSRENQAFHSQVIDILVSRRSSASGLLAAVEDGKIPSKSIPLTQIRRVTLFNDRGLNSIVGKYWGKMKPVSRGEQLAEVRRLNNDLRAGTGNLANGKALFKKQCASCHKLFGEGSTIGPELTTANRADRNFLLISLVDPDDVIRKEYTSLVVETNDGRFLTGVRINHDPATITLADGKNEQQITVQTSEIKNIHESPISLMPKDLYRQFNPQQLRDLFRYLESETGQSVRSQP